MSSVYLSVGIAIGILGFASGASADQLTVCADPDNLPYSNRNGDGFENRIAVLIAKELGAKLNYVWWSQRRGFVRNTLNAGLCDFVAGTASGVEALRASRPYYRSTYVFVTRADRPPIASLDDPALRKMKIGIQLVGGANPPPAQALARRGLASSARGYPVFAHDTSRPAGEAIIQAVARGDIDIAIVWGPIAGYYAARQDVRLVLTPVAPEADGATLPMVFDIAMGVRIGNDAFRAKLNRALVELRPRIDCVLAEYNVPRVDSSRMAMPCSQ